MSTSPAYGDLSTDWCTDPACNGLGCHLLHLVQNLEQPAPFEPQPIIEAWHPFGGVEECDQPPADPTAGFCGHGRIYTRSGENGWPHLYPLPR